jgi:hypothetical protein
VAARRGQNLVLAVGAVALGVVVALTLRPFFTRDEAQQADPRRRVSYLTDTSAAVSTRRLQAARSGASAVPAPPGPSGGAPSGGRTFSMAGGSRLFGGTGAGLWSAGREDEGALHTPLRDLVASPDVAVRLFGTPEGDFVFHRVHGWMRFENGQWVPIAADVLPASIRALFPDLRAGSGAGAGAGGRRRPGAGGGGCGTPG